MRPRYYCRESTANVNCIVLRIEAVMLVLQVSPRAMNHVWTDSMPVNVCAGAQARTCAKKVRIH